MTLKRSAGKLARQPAPDKPRQCFYIDPTQQPVPGLGYIPALVTEGVAGFQLMTGAEPGRQVPWHWGPSLADAEATAEDRNLAMFGVTPEDAIKIILSSMGAQNAGKPATVKSIFKAFEGRQ